MCSSGQDRGRIVATQACGRADPDLIDQSAKADMMAAFSLLDHGHVDFSLNQPGRALPVVDLGEDGLPGSLFGFGNVLA